MTGRCITCGRQASRLLLEACFACYHRWRRATGQVPEQPCRTCGKLAPNAGDGRCSPCATWYRRHGAERPASVERARGEAHGHARLTRLQVEALRAPANRGRSVRALAHEVGVSPGTVADVLAGRTWRHLAVPP
jgi:hypothetical protein